MRTNVFGSGLCYDSTPLPALPVDQDCVPVPRLSQVVALIIVPNSAPRPNDWTTKADFDAILDNSASDDASAKLIQGRGEIQEAEDVIVALGRGERRIARRRYPLSMEVNITYDSSYEFLRSLQDDYRRFRFWIGTLGGRLLGGTQGIKPDLVSPKIPYRGGDNDVEAGFINLEWFADIDPARTNHEELLNVVVNGSSTEAANQQPGSGSNPGGSNGATSFYRQTFTNQSSAGLTWTQNAGNVPVAADRPAKLWVFMNGQKIIQDLQYTVTPDTGAGQATITIDSNTHISGSTYEVFAFD